MTSLGFNQPLCILPFGHRPSFQTKMFGWEGWLNAAQTAKVLLDPYGRGVVVPKNYSREVARQKGDNAATAMKSVVIDPHPYDWEGDTPLKKPSSRTIVYEMHVRGFTRHPSSGLDENIRGTYAGLIERIPYLWDLGITAVELLPVFQFDAQDCPAGLVNYWGYAPVSFFAPHQTYSSRQDPDRKSTRLNSSHITISYAVFCLKKKKNIIYLNII